MSDAGFRIKKRWITGIVLLLGLLAAGAYWFELRRHVVDTDDAQLEGRIYPIVSRVSGYVAEVSVVDNQRVEAGDLLVKIDARDFVAAYDAAKANHEKAKSDVERYAALSAKKEISFRDYEAMKTLEEVTGAEETRAELNLSYAELKAPASGFVSKKSIEVGQLLSPGQFALSIVSDRDLWVVANFKETDLEKIRPGYKATVSVDAYPNLVLKGHVESLQAGTGARFSLLPPENATGNYVKIVQRVPVKIVFDELPKRGEYHLAPGMSVFPEIEVPAR